MIVKGMGFGLLGYAAGVIVGLVLIRALSKNRHDRSAEATMTAAFVAGPVGVLVGLIVAVVM